MKTLDEVIAEMEKFRVCPSSDEADEYCELLAIQVDALQYLKMYRSDQIQYAADRKYWQNQYTQAVENFKSSTAKHLEALKEIKGKNDPLTWDELRTMEGKPVWVEEPFNNEWHGRWEVISTINDTEIWDEDEKNIWMTDEECRYKSNYGKTWQAYRKERSDGLR